LRKRIAAVFLAAGMLVGGIAVAAPQASAFPVKVRVDGEVPPELCIRIFISIFGHVITTGPEFRCIT
jgi:hypothetical protein